MDPNEIENAIYDHSNRLTSLETTVPYLGTREQIAELVSEIRNVKYILSGCLLVFVIDVLSRFFIK